jgi:alpha-amylase/alpha-mannosidase (GH57 family)
MSKVYHALGLTMHQPLGNLIRLHNSLERHEVQQILWCYDRVTRMIEPYADIARLHLAFSGTLLKQFEDPALSETFHDVVDVPAMLERYQRASGIEFLGSGLYHPVFPLIPKEDWDAQAGWWQGLGQKLLGREWFPGFCPPEIGFCQEMIPMLARMNYRYVLVDCIYIKPKREMSWQEMRYRPHIARYDGAEIVVVPVERELSNAQSSGTSPGWWEYELQQRTKFCDFPALVTTWSDGENGGWFRNPNIEASFWGHFWGGFMHRHRSGELGFQPVSINEYLDLHGPGEEVDVHPGAWNTTHHWGGDFTQWTGSLLQKRGFDEIRNASRYYHEVKARFDAHQAQIGDPEGVRQQIHTAYDHLLLAETSCNFFWGSKWVHRSFEELELVYRLLDDAIQHIPADESA